MEIKTNKNLTNQVQIYSVGSDAFYTADEKIIQGKLEDYYNLKRLESEEDNIIDKIHKLQKTTITNDNKQQIDYQIAKLQRRLDYKDWLCDKVESYNQTVRELKDQLMDSIIANESMRTLDQSYLTHNNIISLFESSFTRTLKMPIDKTSQSVMIIKTYYYEMLHDLIRDGFMHDGEKYIYFSSSSGQIRQKKAVFVKESLWDKHANKLMCGLTVNQINEKDGMSVNKLLAYKALSFSASEKWDKFDIDRVVVVDDVKSNLKDKLVDFINRDNYDVTRQTMPIDLEITDGAGMCLPSVSNKSFQFRMPWCKGLISPVPYDKFVDETEGASSKITDIYGKEWDIFADNIQVILFKSQLKMSKFYNSWKDYKDEFVKHNCEAAFLNVEEDIIPDAKLGYQYLQQLVDISDKELNQLASSTNKDIEKVGRDKDTMLKIMGADEDNTTKNSFQKSLEMYPELLNDIHAKETIKTKKKSMVKDARAGKLNINGKYTYILPDWIAVMQNVFMGINNPKGVLGDGEVLCRLYDTDKVDLMRSPALSFEHAVRDNVKINADLEKYFATDAIYISGQDLISKILQADFDGDTILVSPDETLISVVERNAKQMNIVPLEYEMGTAPAQTIDYDSMYNSLKMAFNANIGEVSNTISKIWNSDKVDLKVIKQQTAYNNYIIDMAKTLDLPEPNDEVKAIWQSYSHHTNKLPAFFEHAKEKKREQVSARNGSTVNRLFKTVKNKRIYFADVVGEFDYKILMKNESDEWIVSEEIDKEIIQTFVKLNQQKHKKMNRREIAKDRNNKKGTLPVHRMIRQELLKVHSDAVEVTDVLVKYQYKVQKSKAKTTLWESFGREIVSSMRHNLGILECTGCGDVIDDPRQRQVRCDDCQKVEIRRKDKERKRKNKVSA